MNKQDILLAFATNLRFRRKEKGLSQQRLAEMADLSVKYIQDLEAGRKNCSLIVFLCLCSALMVSPDELVIGLVNKCTQNLIIPRIDIDDQQNK